MTLLTLPCRSWSAVLLTALFALTGCGGSTGSELVVVHTEKEANRIIVELEARGITDLAIKRETRDRKAVFAVAVPAVQISAARQILVQLDLPREERGGLEAMVSSAGLIPSKSDERARLMHALSQELEKTLEECDRVVRARVHIVLPDTEQSLHADPAKAPKPSATVLVKYVIPRVPEPGADASAEDKAKAKAAAELAAKPPLTQEQVSQLVSRSVQGLDQGNVFITFTSTSVQATKAALEAASTKATTETDPTNLTSNTGFAGLPSYSQNKLLYQLFAAVVALGLLCVFLIVKLVKKGRTP